MGEKTFISVFFLIVVFLIAGIATFNYTIDSNYLFSRLHILEKASDDLLSGKIVAGIQNNNDRYFQKLIIKKMKKIPDIVAIGSSRTLPLSASHLGIEEAGNYFNHSIVAPQIKDYIAILGCYKRKGAFPKRIIVEFSPLLFDERFETMIFSDRWQSIASEYYYLMGSINGKTSSLLPFYKLVQCKFSRIRELISYDYTVLNYNNFLSESESSYRIVTNTHFDAYLKMPDGSMHYPYSIRFRNDLICQVLNFYFRKRRTF